MKIKSFQTYLEKRLDKEEIEDIDIKKYFIKIIAI